MKDDKRNLRCPHRIQKEANHLKLVMQCRECDGRATLENEDCFSGALRILEEESSADEVILSHYMESMYHGDAVTLLKKLLSVSQEAVQIAARDPLGEYFGNKKGACAGCKYNPGKLFSGLKDAIFVNIGKFYEVMRMQVQSIGSAETGSGECLKCLDVTKNDFLYLYSHAEELRSFILHRGFQIVYGPKKPPDFNALVSDINNADIQSVARGASRIMERNRKIRPCFSYSWLLPRSPEKSDIITSYQIDSSKVTLYQPEDSLEITYSILPPEYELATEHVMLIQLVKEYLSDHYPRNIDIERSEQAKNYIYSLGKRWIYHIAKREGIQLGKNREEELRTAKSLAKTLARYTAGLGISEYLLSDPNINDVYIDSPVSENRVHVTLSIPDERVHGKCTTNITMSEDEAESLLSRFRYESGKPFSEAMPILETDLQQMNTRVTVIGKPLSPAGNAIAMRRHSTEPWTLLKLIYNRMMSPKAAGLLSFLIDGHSTILVAGSRGSGKTSLIGAMMLELPLTQRILTIEDTLELPTHKMQALGYKVQSIYVQSSVGEKRGTTAEEALRVALRLGESVIVMGEVRGQEAKTLYEAMRAGTAGSSVLGTFHADSPQSVYQRVVYDIGIPPTSFMATDVIVISSLSQPGGSMRQVRRLGQISETVKDSPGSFQDLMLYDIKSDSINETAQLKSRSHALASIAKSWGLTVDDVLQNIRARSAYREIIVDFAKKNRNLNLLNAEWVARTNNAWRRIIESMKTPDYDRAVEEWKAWFERSARYA